MSYLLTLVSYLPIFELFGWLVAESVGWPVTDLVDYLGVLFQLKYHLIEHFTSSMLVAFIFNL